MIKFLSKLISGNNDVSSKRVSAIFTLMNVLILCYMAAIKSGWILPEYMFNGLCLIVGGGLGLTVVEKMFTKNTDTTTSNTNISTTTTASVQTDSPQQPSVDSPDAPDQP